MIALVSTADIYEITDEEIIKRFPDYKILGFWQPKKGEMYIAPGLFLHTADKDCVQFRLIVEKEKVKKLVRITFTPCGEKRQIHPGEWYLYGAASMYLPTWNMPISDVYFPLTKTEDYTYE